MVQSTGNPNQRQAEGDSFDSDRIQSTNYGGLNTMSSVVNIPATDSPNLLNVTIDENGDIGKRLGSTLLQSDSVTNAEGSIVISFSLRSGKDLILAKQNTDIKIFEYYNSTFRTVMTKSNVWSAAGGAVKPDFIATSEVEPRVIMTTGVNVPVQLTFVETITTFSGNSSFTQFSDTRYEFATSSNCGVWLDDTHYSSATVSYSAGVVTVDFGSTIPTGSYILNVVYISWQWWAEAIKLTGDQVYSKTSKFHTTQDDQSIAIPTTILRDIKEFSYADYPIIVLTSSDYNDVYTYKTNRKPSAETEYNFSIGGRYDSTDNDEVVPGISHVTFGAIKASTPPSDPVHFIRGYELKFNGESGEAADNLIVLVDDVTYAFNGTGAASGTQTSNPTYQLRESLTFRSATTSASSTFADFITFDSTSTIGAASTAFIEIISTRPIANNDYVGSAATSNYNRLTPRDGALTPAYGLGIFANYATGSFPRSITLYQGRLVFAGFPNQPMTVLISNTFDSVRAGTFFNNYQIALEDQQAGDPVDVLLTSQLDDLLLACEEFQNQLFVWSRDRMFRIHGGTAGAITPTNLLVNTVAVTGVLNAQSVVKVDTTVFFLSSGGVFDITATIEAGDFTAGERSIKIRNLVSGPLVPNNSSVSWMEYDPSAKVVYLAVSDDVQSLVATNIYAYDLLRASWTKWLNQSGAFFSLDGTVVRVTSNEVVLVLAQTPFVSYPTSIATVDYLAYGSFYPLDSIQERSNLGTYTVGLIRQVTHTYDEEILSYKTDVKSTASDNGFLMIPSVEVEDVKVTSNGSDLTFNVDYRKLDDKTIYFLKPQPASASIVITLLDENKDYPIGVYRDNVLLTETDDYTVATGTGSYVVTLNSTPNASAIIRTGLQYQSYFQTPVFVRDDLSSKTRLFHFYGLFSNKRVSDLYETSDANTTANQDTAELTGIYKRNFRVNLALLFDFRNQGFSRNELYGFDSLYWDDSLYDVDPSAFQSVSHSIVSQPVVGITRSFSALLWSTSASLWDLSGYQIRANRQVRSSIHWSN